MVVQWPKGPGSPIGVITGVDGPRVAVRFDGEEHSRIFNARAGVVGRVTLGKMVQRVSTGATGVLLEQSAGSPPRWRVVLEGQIVSVAEADLRPYKIDSPDGRIADGELGSPEQFRLAVTAKRAALGSLTNDLVSVNGSRVDLKPHQVGVVHRVVSSYPHRFLLCDEVGLGKTIEAGMVLKELRARGAAKRALVIVPPNLVRQWQFELKSKFNETFSILNSDTVKHLRNTQGFDGNPFEAFDSVIVSSNWISGTKWSKAASEVPWDVVIVDEAHHARVRGRGRSRRETRLYKTVRSLIAPDAFTKRAALLLTATPMQLSSSELYSLIEILDPALFPSEEHFDLHRSKVIGLSQLVHELGERGAPPPGPEREVLVKEISEWLASDPETIELRLDSGEKSMIDLCRDLSSRHLLSEILIRNRKKVIGGFMPRQAHRWEVVLTEPERRALDAVQEYVRNGYDKASTDNDRAIGFVMVVFQKLLASSIRALRTSLHRRLKKLEALSTPDGKSGATRPTEDELEEQLEEDNFVDVGVFREALDHSEEAATLKQLIELLDAVPSDSKGESLVRHLEELKALEPGAKVLLFTEFRETQEYLKHRLQDTGWKVELFHGQMKPEQKDHAVEAFRTATDPCILISTEAGGEGRNFQFCHLLVNYDLPWNPMRIEQRIGRVDRIGQNHIVQVFNFWVRGTVEERILSVLDSRIKIFEETVGGLDPILGDTESNLKMIMQMGEVEREQALTKLEERLEKQVAQAREADERLRDFIMETKSYSREIASTLRINETILDSSAQEKLVIQLLKEVRTHLQRNADGTFRVTFNEPFRSDHPEHCDGELRVRTVTFRPDVQPDSQHVEYFAPGNPIVDDLIKRVTNASFPGTASAFLVNAKDLPAAGGWLLIYEITIPGIQELRELRSVFVTDDGSVCEQTGEMLMSQASELWHWTSIPSEDVPADRLDGALEAAESAILNRVRELEERVTVESQQAIERERRKIREYFAYREVAAKDRFEASANTLRKLEASIESESRKAIPMWKARVSEEEQLIADLSAEKSRRLLEIDRKSEPSGDYALFAAARVVGRQEQDLG